MSSTARFIEDIWSSGICCTYGDTNQDTDAAAMAAKDHMGWTIG